MERGPRHLVSFVHRAEPPPSQGSCFCPFFGPKLHPRDPAIIRVQMRSMPGVLGETHLLTVECRPGMLVGQVGCRSGYPDSGKEFPLWSREGLADSPRTGAQGSGPSHGHHLAEVRAKGPLEDPAATNQGHNSHSECRVWLGVTPSLGPHSTHTPAHMVFMATKTPTSCPPPPCTASCGWPFPASAPFSPASSPSDLPSFLPVLPPGCSPEEEKQG